MLQTPLRRVLAILSAAPVIRYRARVASPPADLRSACLRVLLRSRTGQPRSTLESRYAIENSHSRDSKRKAQVRLSSPNSNVSRLMSNSSDTIRADLIAICAFSEDLRKNWSLRELIGVFAHRRSSGCAPVHGALEGTQATGHVSQTCPAPALHWYTPEIVFRGA